ncbi:MULTISPECIES: hypothetical protein [unclassified Microbacterium]|uniref:hypothetical protein n=1 Tax=unclassified Microbacterium TaxID=2609290 RepID=UPI001DE1893D|nr:hypothetical protein [Actinomycetota bacterium]
MTLSIDRRAAVRPALDTVRRLWWLCAAVSLIALAAAAVLAVVDPAEVNWVVWLRGSVVAVASLVFVVVTRAVARGSRRAFTRMRWISILAPIGIGLIIVSPDSGYPLWMKIEQGLIGVLIVVIAVLLNSRQMRAAFPKES